jgi:DNA-binding NarL/FixJ family response regulator
VIRVIIADDQPLVCDGLEAVLSSDAAIEVVGTAGDGEAAVELAEERAPDVAVLDIRMPRCDGLTAAERILTRFPTTRVIMLTTFDLDEYVYRALSIGVSGFLLKQATAYDFINAVKTVAAGESMLSPSVTTRLISAYSGSREQQPDMSLISSLSPREKDVFLEMGRGLSNSEISSTLTISDWTVKSHVKQVLGKLGLRDRTQVVVFFYENGFNAGRLK